MLNIRNTAKLLHLLRRSHGNNCQILYPFSKVVETKTTKKIVLSKQRNKQLIELKKQLGKKQPIKSEKLYEQYHFKDVYKRINTQMESFFYERSYNIQNFNFLLNLISQQTPEDYKLRINEIQRKMSLLKIKPDEKTYNYMIKIASNCKDINLAQQYFKQACQNFLPNKYLYTTLMQTYAVNNDPNMALKILDQMVQKGLQPDIVTYTTLINSFRIGRKLQKCWQVHKKLQQSKIQPDQTYTSVMMKVYAATHDAQKAIKLYRQNITNKNIKPMIETTNAYFKALSSRKQYSNIVIDKFIDMVESGQIINKQTASWALRACATIGNVRSAAQILKLMKIKKVQIDSAILTILLKVYSTACLVPQQDQKFRDVIITDSWKLLQQIDKMGGVNTKAINSMLQIYANSINSEQIDGLILPLYQKFNKEMNMYTYQILIQMYYRMNDFSTAMRVWHQMNKKIQQNKLRFAQKFGPQVPMQVQFYLNKLDQNLRPTFNALHTYLDIGIKLMDMKQVLDALKLFKRYKRLPKNETLKFLGNLQNLPQQIHASLMDFKIKFGNIKSDKKQHKNIEDPQNL